MSSQGPTYKLYEFLGVELPDETNGSGEFVTTCPFCSHSGHFYINEETALFQCKDGACGVEGNPYTFLKLIYEKCLAEDTTPFSYKRLSQKRKKFSKDAYVESKIAWSSDLNSWFIPTFNVNGHGGLTGLSIYSGAGPCYAAPGCSLHLWGLETLNSTGPIFVCEGYWDAIALRWLLTRCEQTGILAEGWTVLAAPGASNLPKSDIPVFQNRDVYLLYDNDEAGRNGTKTATKKLAGVANSIHLLTWPEGVYEDGWDVEDFIRTSTDRLDTILANLLGWCFRFQRGADPTKLAPTLIRNSITEVIRDFEESKIHMYPGLTDCLILTLAVVHSSKLPGEPLWLYCIGDPGRGKSLVLESTLGSDKCIYRTSVTHKAFVSGFRQEGSDSSLLAVLPGRCLVVKDYSNVLSLPHLEQDQLISLLREAYDGRIVRSYGNNVYREYPPAGSPFPDCRFSLVAGVTKEIHSRNHAGLGERFLKYEIPCTELDNILAVEAALEDDWKSHEYQLLRTASVSAFLNAGISDRKITIPNWFKQRIIALSNFIGLCRSPVSRTNGDLDYIPSPESGTRVAKQLRKLSKSLCAVLGVESADEEVYRLIRKVAWDTAHGWRRDLYLYLFQEGEVSVTGDIADGVGFSLGTTHRQLHDMKALKIAYSQKVDGKLKWALCKESKEVILTAKLENLDE